MANDSRPREWKITNRPDIDLVEIYGPSVKVCHVVERSALDAALAERDQALDRVQKLEQVISNSNESIVGYRKELKQAYERMRAAFDLLSNSISEE